MSNTNCPSREELFGCLVGTLPEDEAEGVLEHLGWCSDCQETMQTLNEAEDTLMARVRCAAGKDPYADEPERQEMLARIRLLAGEPVGAARPPLGEPEPEAVVQRELGEYQLLEKLGEGGMGAVYKARQTRLKRIVAIKLLSKERTSDARALARFDREMEAVGAVDHPNIVRAMHAGVEDGTPYLVVEYVDGVNLAELVTRLGPLPIADACELIRQAAVGLQHAHEHGLVHRDIKPSNLMLTLVESSMALPSRGSGSMALPSRDSSAVSPETPTNRHGSGEPCYAVGLVKILDLGLALLRTNAPSGAEMTAAGSAMGTADYMAPEQVTDSHGVDIRADIYSLGCTLYKLLAGRAPFAGPENKNDVARMLAHVTQTPPPLAGVRSDIPPELASVVERMMARDPSGRFATPAEVVAALTPFTAGCDLAALLVEAERRIGKPTASPARSATTGQLSASPVADTSSPLAPVLRRECELASPLAPVLRGEGSGVRGASSAQPQPAAQSARPPRDRQWVRPAVMIGLAAIAAGLLYILFSGIVIRIRDKWGRETVIKPPPGSSVIVEEDGKQVAQVPSPDKEAKPSPEPPPAQPLTIGKPIQLPTPVPLKLKAEPLQIEAEEPIGGLVARPAKIPGLASWTIETRGHRGQIKGLACSPDGKLFASAGSDTSIRLWEPSTGRLVRVIAGGSNGPLAWSPDGAVLAAGWKKEVRLWNPNSGQRVRTFVGQGRVSSLAWRPDGTLLAAAYQVPGSRIDLWDVNSGKLRNTLGLGREGWHVSAIAWLPDGRRLLSCTADGNLLLYDVDKDKPLHTAFTNSPLLAVAPGGNTVVTFGNDRAQVWKIEADRLSKVLTLDAGGTYCRVVFLSKRGAVATFDEVRPLELRDPSTWKVVSIGGRLLPNVAAPSADERLLLAGGYGGGLSATEVESSEVRWQYSGTHFAVGRVKWSPDGKTLVVSYGTQGDCAILGNLA